MLLAALQTLLAESPTPLTRRELLTRWPGDAPRQDTLWPTLARSCEVGLFVRSGTGTKTDAFRYGVVSQAKPTEPAAGQQQAPGSRRCRVALPPPAKELGLARLPSGSDSIQAFGVEAR